MYVVYTNSRDEIIICTLEDEHKMLREYFKEGTGRDLDDYDRTCSSTPILLSSSISWTT